MAPVTTSAVGVAGQIVDDPKLVRFMKVVSEFAPTKCNDAGIDVEALVAQLSTVQTWRFQELADMFDWIDPLNAIDAALTKILRLHPGLLLIGGVDSGAYQPASSLSSS
jgi:hypothetical protein